MVPRGFPGIPAAGGARRVLKAALLLPALAGCYSTTMIPGSAVAPGAEVVFTITDRGREGLRDRLGPGVLRISGRVADQSDSAFVLKANSVEYMNLGTSSWSGEPLTVSRDYVGFVTERKLSRSRSWLAAGLAAGALIGAVLSTDVGGGGGSGVPTPPSPQPALSPN